MWMSSPPGTRTATWVDARRDKLPDLYVLVHVEYAACTMLGWCWSAEVPTRNYAPEGRAPQIAHRDLDAMRWMWEIDERR